MGFYSSFHSLKDIKADYIKIIINKMEWSLDINLNNIKTKSKGDFRPSIHINPVKLVKKLNSTIDPTISKKFKTNLKPIKYTLRFTLNNRIS